MKSISAVASDLGLDPNDVIPWGRETAKVSLAALDRRPATGRLILVSAMTPTPAGEGKTTTTIGLAQGLAAIGRRACA
ncbi:MAG: formate--tetrahydrofolate ligase, partial [Vicinamibacterales bacterium]|nr:formate--tetrahydrofolate ligase [Vicinamibacterales bacterium]